MPLPCPQTLFVWMPQHRPCSHSVLTWLLQQGQGRDTPQQGVVQIWPHVFSMYAVSCSSHVISALGRTVGNQCLDPSKAAFTLSSVRAHTETETIAGSIMAPLPYPSCSLTSQCLHPARWTQSPSTSYWGLKPTKVVSNGLYPARATFLP